MPGIEISPPQCAPTRFGLLTVAEVEEPEAHWEVEGAYYQAESCDTITSQVIECQDDFDEHPVKATNGSGLSYPHSDPFLIVAPHTCSTFGQSLEESYRFAERRLEQAEDRAVEAVFWSGVDSQGNPVRGTIGASNPVDLTPASGAVNLTDALAVLESWAGDNSACAPVLHMNRGLGNYLAERNLVQAYSGVGLVTRANLSRIVLGSGYGTEALPGFPAEDGTAWVFVTGAVKAIRSPVFFASAQDDPAAAIVRATNDVVVFGERSYALAVGPCGVAGIKVQTRSAWCDC